MAKKTTKASAGAGKPKPRKKPAAKTPAVRKKASGSRRSGQGEQSQTAADALFKLLESPLVADLLAVGATAALAAIAEHRSSRRTGDGASAKRAAKAAGKAAAAAIGRRLATEFEEIKKASSKSKSGARA